MKSNREKRKFFLLTALAKSSWGIKIQRLGEGFLYLSPLRKFFKKKNYRFVLVGHPAELGCIAAARVSSKLGIPVFCNPLGLDNLETNPLLFEPDFLILWGEEQVCHLKTFHVPLNSEFSRIRTAVVGNLINDAYISCKSDKNRFCSQYGLDGTEELILFSACIESYFPGQIYLADLIVGFIRKHHLNVKLLVRLRPEFDVEIWSSFRDSNADIVILQHPQVASYDKSSHTVFFDFEHEREEINSFVNTMNFVSLVINVHLSTMGIDAQVFGVPAVNLLFSDEESDKRIGWVRPYQMIKEQLFPKWKLNNLLQENDLSEFLDKFFLQRDRENLMWNDAFEFCAASSNDGLVGQRFVDAIEGFLGRERST